MIEHDHSRTRRLAFAILIAGGILWLATNLSEAQEYAFSTIAGVPGGPGTNDGVNQSARFNFPVGVTVDSTGNVYVADFLNHTIRKLTASGTNWQTVTIAGLAQSHGYADGTNSDARFDHPSGIALDSTGNLFVTERINHTVRKVSPVGTNWVVSTVAGLAHALGSDDGTNTDARFDLPSGITIDISNHLYVTDTANFTIREIVQMGTNWVVSTIAGSVTNFGFADGINAEALFNYPYDIASDTSGKLYVADWGNYAIRELSRSGTNWAVETIAGLSGLPGGNDGPGSAATFNNPAGIKVDNTGNLYVADQSNNTIRKIVHGPTDWTVSTIGGHILKPGSTDGVGTNALFKKPWGIAIDRVGNLFIGDYSNSTIRQGTPQITSAPSLHLSVHGNQVILTWPVSANSYILETTGTLDPGVAWSPLTNGIASVGDVFVLTNSLGPLSAFYRLKK